ncbi:MAG: SdiA-regulated domain-containing protein [Saprospiraceae bacterium]|nr:SdiA-regulated domain-containing protein [Saprospiraceae bacterium]
MKITVLLLEISDLSFDAATHSLWCVADEKGKLYRIQLPAGNPIDIFPFGEDGDFEGLEMVGNVFYTMESNGRITQIEQATTPNPVVTKFENPSLAADDCEAFMHDPTLKKLIIGVKLPASEGEARPFFAFDLETKQLDPAPIFTISLSDIQAFLRKNGLVGKPYEQWLKDDAVTPGPSASAIHPQTGNYYLLASVGKMLLVTSPDGEILHVAALDKKRHPQPEGLAFGDDGTMYISNEADEDVAKIYVYVGVRVMS